MQYLDLILNLSLLISISIVSGFINVRFAKYATARKVLQGVLFGGAAVLGMLRPMNLGEGLIFDGRSVMISLGALYFGPITAVIAAIMPATLRIAIGGDGLLMGVLVILMSAGVGLLYGKKWRSHGVIPSIRDLYLFGLVVHVLMVLLMIFLPAGRIVPTMLNLGPAIVILYPLATILAGRILSNELTLRRRLEELQTNERKYRDSLEFIPIPVGIANASGSILYLNNLFTQTYGYTLDDIPTIDQWSHQAYPDPGYREQMARIWEEDIVNAHGSGGSTPPRVYQVTCRDGSVRHVHLSMRKLDDLFLTVFQDLTAHELLESTLRRQLQELSAARDATINSMAILSEYRDSDTGAHIQRTKLYVKAMIDRIGEKKGYTSDIRDLIWHSAPLHDIGKVAIPDSILLKPGRLTPEEEKVMQKHVVFGSEAIRRTQENIPDNSFLDFACEIAEFHHEWWDGSGYPHGISGETIPLCARIMAIADVYDACISKRPYKEPIPHDEVVKIINAARGTHFDPELVDIFNEMHKEFDRIAQIHAE